MLPAQLYAEQGLCNGMRPSVRLSVCPVDRIAATVVDGFAAERWCLQHSLCSIRRHPASPAMLLNIIVEA